MKGGELMIEQFRGVNAFLSNFFRRDQFLPTPVGLLVFPANENFYVWCKTHNPLHKIEIMKEPNPGIVKKMGSKKGFIRPDGSLFKIDLRPDWDEIKDQAMMAGLELKFGQNEDLRQALIATAPHVLQEGNWWGDEYWGVSLKTGKGLNKLGLMLMDLRGRLILGQTPVINKLVI
jgi:ribA/ribD-fused uncharacterized protein